MNNRWYLWPILSLVVLQLISLNLPKVLASPASSGPWTQELEGLRGRPEAAALGPVVTVSIPASKDNTLYQDTLGLKSNGAGQYFFAGTTNRSSVRRGVIAFDVAAQVPRGATIVSAALRLHMSKSQSGDRAVTLHKLLADWGAAGSNAPGEEGDGTVAQLGDATWIHRFYDQVLWATPGGEFAAVPSALAMVGGPNVYAWGSTPAMVADVQGWLGNPAGNFGWLVQVVESQASSAKRFDSREHPDPALRPELVVQFTMPYWMCLPVVRRR